RSGAEPPAGYSVILRYPGVGTLARGSATPAQVSDAPGRSGGWLGLHPRYILYQWMGYMPMGSYLAIW
ncbi:MAG: hypothetical protein QXT37_07720, partial [Thermofilaceae archaeon]